MSGICKESPSGYLFEHPRIMWFEAIVINNTLLFLGACILVGSMFTETDAVTRLKTIPNPAKRVGAMAAVYGLRGLRIIAKQVVNQMETLEKSMVPARVAVAAGVTSAFAAQEQQHPDSSGPEAALSNMAATVGFRRRRLVDPDTRSVPVAQPVSEVAAAVAAAASGAASEPVSEPASGTASEPVSGPTSEPVSEAATVSAPEMQPGDSAEAEAGSGVVEHELPRPSAPSPDGSPQE